MIVDTKQTTPIYHKDLEIKPEYDDRGAPCLGTLIFEDETGHLNIRYLNKNEKAILAELPHQTTLRLQHMKSFSPLQQKRGTLIGELTRIRNLTNSDFLAFQQFVLLRKEINILGYSTDFLTSAMNSKLRTTGDCFWTQAINFLRENDKKNQKVL